MRRRASSDKGFLISLILNMALSFEWPILAAVLAATHFLLGWPRWLPLAALAVWVLRAVIVTAMLSFAFSIGNSREEPVLPNKNPYTKHMDSDGNLK